MSTSMWRSIGRFVLTPDVRVIVQVADRDSEHPPDNVEGLQESAATLGKLARLLARLVKAHAPPQ